MRYGGPVHKEVDPGGEKYIGKARTLLGTVLQRMKTLGLKQLSATMVTPDGFRLQAGKTFSYSFIKITGGRPEEEGVQFRSRGIIFQPFLGFVTAAQYTLVAADLENEAGLPTTCQEDWFIFSPLRADSSYYARSTGVVDDDGIFRQSFFGYQYLPPYSSSEDGINPGDRDPDGPIDFASANPTPTPSNPYPYVSLISKVSGDALYALEGDKSPDGGAAFDIVKPLSAAMGNVNWIMPEGERRIVVGWDGPASRSLPKYILDITRRFGDAGHWSGSLDRWHDHTWGRNLYINGVLVSTLNRLEIQARIFGSYSSSVLANRQVQCDQFLEDHISGAAIYIDPTTGTEWILALVFAWKTSLFDRTDIAYEQTENTWHLFARPRSVVTEDAIADEDELSTALDEYAGEIITLEELQAIYAKWELVTSFRLNESTGIYLEAAFQTASFFSQDATKVVVSANYLVRGTPVGNPTFPVWGKLWGEKYQVHFNFNVDALSSELGIYKLSASPTIGKLTGFGGSQTNTTVFGAESPLSNEFETYVMSKEETVEMSQTSLLAADYINNTLVVATFSVEYASSAISTQALVGEGEGNTETEAYRFESSGQVAVQIAGKNISISPGAIATTTIFNVETEVEVYGEYLLERAGTQQALRFEFIDLRAKAFLFYNNTWDRENELFKTEAYFGHPKGVTQLSSFSIPYADTRERELTESGLIIQLGVGEEPGTTVTSTDTWDTSAFINGSHPYHNGVCVTDGLGTFLVSVPTNAHIDPYYPLSQNKYCVSPLGELYVYPEQSAQIYSGMQMVTKIIDPEGRVRDLNAYLEWQVPHSISHSAWMGLGILSAAYIGE